MNFTGIKSDNAISEKVWDIIPLMNQYKEKITQIVDSEKPILFEKHITGDIDKKYLTVS